MTAQQRVKNQVQGFPVLVGFAIRQLDHMDRLARCGQGFLYRCQIQGGHRRIGDDGNGRRIGGHRVCKMRQTPGGDMDGISATLGVNMHYRHLATSFFQQGQ